jgi:hypothetical protein
MERANQSALPENAIRERPSTMGARGLRRKDGTVTASKDRDGYAQYFEESSLSHGDEVDTSQVRSDWHRHRRTHERSPKTFFVMATVPKRCPGLLLGEEEARMISCSKERLITIAIAFGQCNIVASVAGSSELITKDLTRKRTVTEGANPTGM